MAETKDRGFDCVEEMIDSTKKWRYIQVRIDLATRSYNGRADGWKNGRNTDEI